MELVRCRIQTELDTVAKLLSNDARELQVSLVVHPANTDISVKANGEKLRQAFLNLALNALQATSAGGRVTMQVTVPQETVTCMCEIRFSDNGTGIDAEALTKIFEPFYTTKPDGTGLGLAITKKIIEGHGGTLNVESAAGQGTTVLIRLPMLQAEE